VPLEPEFVVPQDGHHKQDEAFDALCPSFQRGARDAGAPFNGPGFRLRS
jgi:hypothetical protein